MPWYDTLIRAHSSFTDPDDQRRARLTAALLLVMTAAGLAYISGAIAAWRTTRSPELGLTLMLGAVAMVAIALAWVVLRYGKLNLANLLHVSAIQAGGWVLAWSRLPEGSASAYGTILLIAIVGTSFLRGQALVSHHAINIVLFLGTPIFFEVPAQEWWLGTLSYLVGALVLATMVLMTDQRAAQLEVQAAEADALLGGIDALIISIDRRYQVLACNEQARQALSAAFGVKVQPGDNLLACLPPEVHARATALASRALSGEATDEEQTFQWAGGTVLGRISSLPLRGKNGDVMGVTLHVTNLSEREAARHEHETRIKEAHAAIINAASHEFNTPLTPILMQMSLLRAGHLGDVNDRQAKALDIVQRNLDDLGRVVEMFLEVSRLEQHLQDATHGETSLQEVLHDPLTPAPFTNAALDRRASNLVLPGTSTVLSLALEQLHRIVASNSVNPEDLEGVVRESDGYAVIQLIDNNSLANESDLPRLGEAGDNVRGGIGRAMSLYVADRVARRLGGQAHVRMVGPKLVASFILPAKELGRRRPETKRPWRVLG